MVRSTPSTRTVDPRSHGASGTTANGELVVRVRQRGADNIPLPDRDRYSSCPGLCAVGRRGMEQPANPQSPNRTWMVHSCFAWLGLQFHAPDFSHPHVAGLSLPIL